MEFGGNRHLAERFSSSGFCASLASLSQMLSMPLSSVVLPSLRGDADP
jgi:hypothetical protein